MSGGRTPVSMRQCATRPASGRQLGEGKRKRLVLVATGLLRRGDPPTPFAREGWLIAAVRSALILSGGWTWRDADRAAREVTHEALRAIGAKRPTWKEASTPHYAQARCVLASTSGPAAGSAAGSCRRRTASFAPTRARAATTARCTRPSGRPGRRWWPKGYEARRPPRAGLRGMRRGHAARAAAVARALLLAGCATALCEARISPRRGRGGPARPAADVRCGRAATKCIAAPSAISSLRGGAGKSSRRRRGRGRASGAGRGRSIPTRKPVRTCSKRCAALMWRRF